MASRLLIFAAIPLSLSLSLSLSSLLSLIGSINSVSPNFYILGSTSPNALVTIVGMNITAAAPKVSLTVNANEDGIFKPSFRIDTEGIYRFTVTAAKNGATATPESFVTHIDPATTSSVSGVEVLFPEQQKQPQEPCNKNPDLNGDGKVNLVDVSILLFNWGTFGCRADLDGSGRVDAGDLKILLKAWTG